MKTSLIPFLNLSHVHCMYIFRVTLNPIEVVFVVAFCCLIYSYKNRTQDIKKIINGSLNYIIMVSSSSSSSSSRLFYWIILKKPTCSELAQPRASTVDGKLYGRNDVFLLLVRTNIFS